jgi:hypothetical protein
VSVSTFCVKRVFVCCMAFVNLMSMVVAGLSECTHVRVLKHVGVSVPERCELVVGVGVAVVVVVRATPIGMLICSSNIGSVPS